MTQVDHSRMANAIRGLAMDAVEKAKSGHPGLPMGAADIATVLFTQFLKFDAGAPDWPDRDRFVLSAGHGSMLLYALLHLTGAPGMSIARVDFFADETLLASVPNATGRNVATVAFDWRGASVGTHSITAARRWITRCSMPAIWIMLWRISSSACM